MKLIKLKYIGDIISGSTPDTNRDEYWNGDISWVTPKELGKLETPYLNRTERNLSKLGLKSCSATVLPKGSILFTSRAPIGLVAIANIDVATNQGFKSIRLFEGYYPLYIYYILKYYAERIQVLGTGTTFKEISKATLEEFEIPVPDSIDEQIRISHLLNRIDLLIEKRKQSLNLLWNFTQSTYQHLFSNFDGPKVSFSNAFILNPQKSEIRSLPNNTDVSFVPMANISTTGELNLSNVKELNEVKQGFTYFKEGDVIFAKISPSMENGKGGIAKGLKNSIGFGTTEFHVLRPIEKISNSEWLYYFTMQDRFRRSAQQNMIGSGGQKRVTSSFFNTYKTVIPPFENQNRFATILEKVNYVRSRLTESLNQLESLFVAINQQVFNGEIPLHKIDIKTILHGSIIDNVNITSSKVELPIAPIKEKLKKQRISKKERDKLYWDEVSTERISKWIKARFKGYYFNSEMLQRFLLEEHLRG